ncbi:MAG TPA: IS1595 family transposase [Alphaproteobacteria bacterium]|nr:IS1595 family transposase [Alphaproteobacteria bacterium]
MSADLSSPRFHDETEARKFLEATRWPEGPVCPHCGTVNEAYENASKPGVYRCASVECRKDFSVTVGTLFERSHVPLHKWLLATHLLMAGKKGVSAHQLHRMLGVTYKTAWFMAHRIREALRPNAPSPLGGQNKVVEADETYVGGKAKNRKNKVPPKEAVFSLVERGGKVRSRHVADVTGATLRDAMVSQIDKTSYLMTDESPTYTAIGTEFAGHGTVNHSAEEYVRAYFWHTNTAEGFFSILKRGITGVYHHVSKEHLHRYLAEFDFRYNERESLGVDDAKRAEKALKGIEGRRLTYGGSQARP